MPRVAHLPQPIVVTLPSPPTCLPTRLSACLPCCPPHRYLSALRSCFAASGKELVGFERYMALRKSGGNHCHFNAIAVPGAG